MRVNPITVFFAVVLHAALFSWLAHYPVQGQPALGATVQQLDRKQECTVLEFGDVACRDSEYFSSKDSAFFQDNDDEAIEEDPMLAKMPGLDFKAYRRGDISRMYREEPGSRVEKIPSFKGQAGKFVNMSPERLDLYWENADGPMGHYISYTGPFESTGTSTYSGHVFHFIRPKTEEIVCTFQMQKGTSVYYCDPFVANDPSDPSAGKYKESILSKTVLDAAQLALYNAAQFNRKFAPLYKNFTGGSEWLGNFPTQPPKHHMWRADYFGQEHQIRTRETQFLELPPQQALHRISKKKMRRNSTDSPVLMKYRAPGVMNITIRAISVEPRIFQIDGFLSDVEVDHILDLAMQKNLQRSTTGMPGNHASVSSVRTSRTTWLPRDSSPIMDAIIRRGADVLNIDEAMFRDRDSDEMNTYTSEKFPINEDLQLVHYDQGQQYTAHHDFGYPDTRPNAPSRSINLCLYLNDEGLVGGETAFPRARNAVSDEGIKGVPQKGKAMIFYMKTPDGNLDDLSQHAAMPVIEGEKWFANLWIWDPVRD